jgi:hypothetical protein
MTLMIVPVPGIYFIQLLYNKTAQSNKKGIYIALRHFKGFKAKYGPNKAKYKDYLDIKKNAPNGSIVKK